MYEYNAEVLRVVDGDTVDLLVDIGFNVKIKERFRLYGINAPETRTKDLDEKKRGLDAKEWLIARINHQPITIKTIKDKKGKFGRYLAEIYSNGENLNKQMVTLGFAVEYMV